MRKLLCVILWLEFAFFANSAWPQNSFGSCVQNGNVAERSTMAQACSAFDSSYISGIGGNPAAYLFPAVLSGQLCTIRYAHDPDSGLSFGCTEQQCPAGAPFWDSGTNSCVSEAPPNTTPEECGPGERSQDFTVGGQISYHCVPDYFGDDEPCNDVAGYFNDKQVCNDDRNDCEATGGSYGFIGGDNLATCIPSDYGDQLPTCDSGTVNTYNEDGGNGFACSAPEDHTPEDSEDSSSADETDTDGDGLADKDDDDIDGDGVPNGSDPDVDGDGIANGDDLTPNGESAEATGEEEESSASGGGSCGSRPSCKGDAIACAILYQNWKTRCEVEKLNSQGEDSVSGGEGCDVTPTCEGDVIECAIFIQTWRGRCDGGIDEFVESDISSQISGLGVDTLRAPDEDLTGTLTGIFTVGASASTCPADLPLSLSSGTVSLSFGPVCDVAYLLRPLLIFIFSLIGFRIVMRAF